MFKKVILIIVLTTITAAQALAQENRWFHVRPLESNSMSVLIDFQITDKKLPDTWGDRTPTGPSSYEISATPAWFNVRDPHLTSVDNVWVMVINNFKRTYRGQPHREQEIQEFSLNYVEAGHFAGQSQPWILDYQFNDGYALTQKQALEQEVIIWVNGQIYKDPLTGQNLKFNFKDYM